MPEPVTREQVREMIIEALNVLAGPCNIIRRDLLYTVEKLRKYNEVASAPPTESVITEIKKLVDVHCCTFTQCGDPFGNGYDTAMMEIQAILFKWELQ